MNRIIKIMVCLVVLAGFGLGYGFVAHAQAPSNARGLTISPFLLERKMEKGEQSEEIIDIINTSDRALPVVLSVNDFEPIGDTGQQVFLDSGQGDPRYSLSSWVTIQGSPKPVLQPGEKTSIHFTLAAPVNAEDGGHYGAILFTFQNGQADGSAVAIRQKLGAIILVKLGKAVEDGQIAQFRTEKSFYDYPPVNFITVFKNTGNVHVKPRGGIGIKNMFGKTVANVLVNENANNVLSNTERQFISSWKDAFAFGRYTAEVKLVYGDSGSVETATYSFWVLPWKIGLVVIGALFIFILLLVMGVRRYNRWLIKKFANRK